MSLVTQHVVLLMSLVLLWKAIGVASMVMQMKKAGRKSTDMSAGQVFTEIWSATVLGGETQLIICITIVHLIFQMPL